MGNDLQINDKILGKIFESLKSGFGTIYEPTKIKKNAEARSYEIDLISNSIRKNNDINITYKSKDESVCMQSWEMAKQRVALKELNRQSNINSIINKTRSEINSESEISGDSIEKDWIVKFIDCCQDVSNEFIQSVWAKILSNEIKKPNNCSLRALDILKNMDINDVKTFEKLINLAQYSDERYFILNDSKLLQKYGINLDDILDMEECGLITTKDLMLNFDFNKSNEEQIIYGNIIYSIKKTNENYNFGIPIFSFTKSAKQLIDAIGQKIQGNYIQDFYTSIVKYGYGIEIIVH